MNMRCEVKYDLLVLGGATTLGGLVVRHISAFLPKKLIWGVVGRRGEEERELSSLVTKISDCTPGVEVCEFTKNEITVLTTHTKVVIALPTPNMSDEAQVWLVEACVKSGTHYIDAKSGENCWLKAMIQKYHNLAQDTGAILLSHVNAVGATQDLLTLCAVTDLREKLSLRTREAICSFQMSPSPYKNLPPLARNRKIHTSSRTQPCRSRPRPPSPNQHHQKHPRRDSTPPWYLSPLPGRDGSCLTNALGLRKELSLGLLADSSPYAAHNRVMVHRSWALLEGGKQYGPSFYYNEYEEVSNTIEGIKARLGKRRYVADVGLRKGKTANVSLRVVAIADQEGPFPDRALAELTYNGEMPQLTAVLVAQAAATLLFTRNISRKVGSGFITPAVVGKSYVERLRGVGVDIESSLV